jgi:hypothetical protein
VTSVAQIKQAISDLSSREFAELEAWFVDERNRRWDQQIEADSGSGALDFLLKEVDQHRRK